MTSLDRCATRHHYEVETIETVLAETETLAYESLDPVAVGGFTNLLFGNCQAQAWRMSAVGPSQYGKVLVGRSVGSIKNTPKIPGSVQTTKTGKTVAQATCRQTVSRLRPLALRAFSTFRPPRVAIRALKP